MPMMIAFEKASYSPGEVVSGHVVVIRSTTPQKVKGLSIRILGRANRILSEIENPIRSSKKELYFDDKVDIFGHDGRDSTLSVGETLFPFSFTLPHGLPSSFVWGRGNVLYFVEARLTRCGWKDDKKTSVRLSVDGVHDLNLDPIAPLPAQASASKYVNHLLTKSGPFGFSFLMQKSGFVRGHAATFQISVKNLSKVDAKRLRVTLIQEIVQDGKQSSSSVIEEVRGPAVASGEIQIWDGRLKIPDNIPPTNLGNLLNFSPVLSLNYFMQVELSPKSATVDPLTTKVPIIIGTIPLISSRSRFRHHHHDDTCPMSSTTPPTTNPSQFSPGFLIHHHGSSSSLVGGTNEGQGQNQGQGHHPCRHCPPPHISPQAHHLHHHNHHHNYGIYRRLRNLQSRRRRESPPPSYDDVVSEATRPPQNNNSTITTMQTNEQNAAVTQSTSASTTPCQENNEGEIPPSKNQPAKITSTEPEVGEDKVTIITCTPSTSHHNQVDQVTTTTMSKQHHVVTVQIKSCVDEELE
ncbi:arrestin domain-containing protein 1 [Folsomia candida]|uniref:arrestin domain-containing protein 1 n=1 Tax=Folsomia candida TaxID=158441 RepID=UPI000B8FCE89|nr:arrestin domain-containing protein 1 [Folsomia candida]XP_035707018.1 arrestin domain-containing protein 1 [Folsomia candida]